LADCHDALDASAWLMCCTCLTTSSGPRMSKISPQGHFMKRLHGRRCAGASAGCPGEGVEAGQEVAQGRGRAEGNADVDPRQEAGQGGGREEAGGPTEGLSSSVKEAVRPPEASGSCGRDAPASELPRRRLRRRTWQLGPATLQRLQGRFRTVQRRASERQSRGQLTRSSARLQKPVR
jgi:hypothetical protein